METMSTTLHNISALSGMDVHRYGRLLAKFAPKVIQTEAENEEALAVIESLLECGEARLSTEELALLDLLGTLIEKFESSAYKLPEGDPAGTLEILMEGRGLKPVDMTGVLGSRAGFRNTFPASGRSVKTRPNAWGSSSRCLPLRLFRFVPASRPNASRRNSRSGIPSSLAAAALWKIYGRFVTQHAGADTTAQIVVSLEPGF
jgi:antitoxin component HigA of HigAB toxin-antitoxin module